MEVSDARRLKALGGVDGFDQDEGCSKGYESPGVPRRFFASWRDTLEPFQLADHVLDTGATTI